MYKLYRSLEQSILNEEIERASEEDLQYIRSLIDEMRQPYSEDSQNQNECVKSNYHFYIALAEIAKNNLFEGLYSIILCLSFTFIR
ncbi:FCD domain-containing protein [Succinatimonas hippei]|uniref:FCD domain-containing protein n=1 Tax=Succinatimonas hippei TaxID=626938 RepID=UPI003364C3D8